jgi:two-component system cell cycle response regulator DivK
MATILLVEDNPHNRAVFETVLRSRGHVVEVAVDGKAALDALAGPQPDLVLLDLSLPCVDGWTVVRTIRGNTDPRRAGLPVIALTAHAMRGDRERALEAGCDAYVSKPVSPRELARIVGEMLEQRKAA